MRKLRFVLLAVMCIGLFRVSSAVAATFEFFVVDICTSDGKGSSHPDDNVVTNFCQGLADECGSGSTMLYQYVENYDYHFNYTTAQINALKGECLRVQPYGYYNGQNLVPSDFLGTQSSGWMVVCVAGGSGSAVDVCDRMLDGCDPQYRGETQWKKLVLDITVLPLQILPGRIYDGSIDNIDCCRGETSAVCIGGNNQWTTSGGCQYGNYAKSCNLDGTCSTLTGESNGQARCLPGYFSDNGVSVFNKAKCGGGASGMMCDPCPTADSGWTATSPLASSACSQCYETKTPANCASGTLSRQAASSCASYSSTTTGVLYAPVGWFVAGDDCVQCFDTNRTYPNSSLVPPLVKGTSAGGNISPTQCYVGAGTYYDELGGFTTSTSCYYNPATPEANAL